MTSRSTSSPSVPAVGELDPIVCECGVALAIHPPLPRPGPLNRWRAEHQGLAADRTWNGHERQMVAPPPATPELVERRTAAMRGLATIAYRNGRQ